MAGISKYDMPSGSPDGFGYMNAQRGAYALEKSGNFREGAESRLVSSLPGTSRPGGGLSQADPGGMFQSLLSDLKPAGLEQKFPRAGEIKRTLNNIFGVSSEDSIPAIAGMTLTLSAWEEIRRMKSSLSECSMKARNRSKAFGEVVSKIDKYTHGLSRKRSRADISSGERPDMLLPGGAIPRTGTQSHLTASGLDNGAQKSEKRSKSAVPSRQARTAREAGRPELEQEQSEEEEVGKSISILEEKLHEVVMKKRGLLTKLEKAAVEARTQQQSELERIALDKLVGTAYQKYMDCSGPNTNKNAKIVANRLVPTLHPKVTSDYNSNLPPQSVLKVDVHDSFQSLNHLSEQVTMREDAWSHKVSKKELMLDVVGGSSMSSLRSPSGIGSSLLSGVKGKRSERERDGKGQNRGATSRNNTAKSAQPVLSMKGERKNITKPKQKTAQLSTSVNGLRSKATEASNTILPVTPKSHETVGSAKKEGLIPSQPGMQNMSNDLDLCDLQLPELDGDFSGHGQDISSWLNIDEDGMQDEDFLGLEIPMDDLSEVNMMI